MEWNKIDASHEVSLINYSNFVKILDLTQRWIYKGSLTTPPCLSASDEFVYWNVLHAVYPIK